MLETLDELEQHPRLYTRTATQCVLMKSQDQELLGKTIDCEVYLVHGFKKELLSLPALSCYDHAQHLGYTLRKERRFELYKLVKE